MAETNLKPIQINDKQIDLNNPKAIVDFANTLKAVVVQNNLYDIVKGKNFVNVEGWQFAGYSMGIVPVVVSSENLMENNPTFNKDNKPVYKYRSEVVLRRVQDGATIGRGFAICSNQESTKRSFDEYAIASMAQTRAIGKAYRSTIGWVMKLAGYETTPLEEIQEDQVNNEAEVALKNKEEVNVYLSSLNTADKAKFLRFAVGFTDEEKLTDFHYKQIIKKNSIKEFQDGQEN